VRMKDQNALSSPRAEYHSPMVGTDRGSPRSEEEEERAMDKNTLESIGQF